MTPHLRVLFRADAAPRIGAGHVMRCLTLAQLLKDRGGECRFVCKAHPGHMGAAIRAAGFEVALLPSAPAVPDLTRGPYADWLGGSWEEDLRQTAHVANSCGPDWIVVDHYALDARWEAPMREGRRLLALDDLADRPHTADLLLDPTLGRQPTDYAVWLQDGGEALCGSDFALLRAEFAASRPAALQRPTSARIGRMLLSMGAMDADNVNLRVLNAIRKAELPQLGQVDILIGANAPGLNALRRRIEASTQPVRLCVEATDVAGRMAAADLAIGASGGMAWERCCIGLPAVGVVLAENQRMTAEALEAQGALVWCDLATLDDTLPAMLRALDADAPRRQAMRQAASRLVDGQGAIRVVARMDALT